MAKAQPATLCQGAASECVKEEGVAAERGKEARKTRAVKTVTTEVRDAKQEPSRSDGMVPLPQSERGGSRKAAQGVN